MKKLFFISLCLFTMINAFALPFNSNLKDEELIKLDSGELLVKNINYSKYICLSNKSESYDSEETYEYVISLLDEIKNLNPKYLAEVIQKKPYKGNEDLPEKLQNILLNVPAYAGIPYYSVRNEAYYDLYTSAKILEITDLDSIKANSKFLKVEFDMNPFGIVYEDITIKNTPDIVYYSAINQNKLRYFDKFDCVGPQKMEICILLFRDGENWILYGIGGVNAPRIPFFVERIQVSFINRINTFCSYIFSQF